jgi:para-nitrobenzyl esterase
MYRLDFAPGSGRLKGDAYHTEDLDLVWNEPDMRIANGEAEAALAKQMHAAWVVFIKGGTPRVEGLPEWPEYTLEARATMVLDTVSRVEERPQQAELRLWDGVL